MNNAIKVWQAAIEDVEERFDEIARLDGNLVDYQREAGFAMQLFAKSEDLQKCSPQSIRSAVINVANVGLSLSPALKLAYLVPRKGQACLDISYIGLVKIATDSGGVLAVSAITVRATDKFISHGPFELPTHEYDPFATEEARGAIVGVYVTARLSSGILQVDTMSREAIDKIRGSSKSGAGPWGTWFEEMAKKSAIKRASKLWPRTERLSAAESILNEHEGLDNPPPTPTPGAVLDAAIDPTYPDYEADVLPHLEEAAQGGIEALAEAFRKLVKTQNKSTLWTRHSVALKAVAEKADSPVLEAA